jgi:hypothetical protein
VIAASFQSIMIAQFLMTGKVSVILKDGHRYSYDEIVSEGSRRSWCRRVMER